VLTLNGWVDYYLILFVHLDTRRLFITPATRHPTDEWMIQQAKNFLIHIEEQGLQITHLIRDNDGKFTGGGLDAILESVGAEIVTTSLRAPNMNPYAERTIQSVQTENLDHFPDLPGDPGLAGCWWPVALVATRRPLERFAGPHRRQHRGRPARPHRTAGVQNFFPGAFFIIPFAAISLAW
jgi:transposase InsO family protein